jgi:hypothetical protein
MNSILRVCGTKAVRKERYGKSGTEGARYGLGPGTEGAVRKERYGRSGTERAVRNVHLPPFDGKSSMPMPKLSNPMAGLKNLLLNVTLEHSQNSKLKTLQTNHIIIRNKPFKTHIHKGRNLCPVRPSTFL